MSDLQALLAQARETSWAIHGKRLTIFLPGMFTAYGRTGRYPAVSLTGDRCDQGCAHCGGRLLTTMLKPDGPEGLLEYPQFTRPQVFEGRQRFVERPAVKDFFGLAPQQDQSWAPLRASLPRLTDARDRSFPGCGVPPFQVALGAQAGDLQQP